MKNNRKVAIQLINVTKKYVIRHEKPTFAERFVNYKQKEVFTALDNINLTIFQGEKVGIIGANGAGKTTLLKIISSITTPTNGLVKTNGKVVSLIDLEAGFHPDLTGEQNIFLNGLVIGMSRQEIKNKRQKIIDFAGLGSFIDAPLFTYSQGMKLRLGFSICMHSDADILIFDEGIVVGDQEFREKSMNMLNKSSHRYKTVVYVTHWTDFLQQNCERIIWMNNRQIFKDGDTQKLLKQFSRN